MKGLPSAPRVLQKIGITLNPDGSTAATDRTRGSVPTPSPSQSGAEYRSRFFTYFTKVPDPNDPPQIIYNGDRQWTKVTLLLETAGPVAVGTDQNLDPVLSGKGTLLTTGLERTFMIAKGDRLFILATAVNRVGVQIEPLPWLEQITGLIAKFVKRVVG